MIEGPNDTNPNEFVDFEAEEEARKVVEVERLEEIREHILRTFESPSGKFVLGWLYDLVRMGKSTFVPGQPDVSAFNEGKRWVLLQIMGQMQIDDEEIFRRARGVSQQLERHEP